MGLYNVKLKEGQKLVVAQDTPVTKQPNYFRFGNGTKNRHDIQAINLFKESNKCGTASRAVLEWVMDGMVWDKYEGHVEFVVKLVPDSSAGKQTLKRGFKELSEKDLVRRVKRSHYMINPAAMITDYEKQLAVWNSID